MKMISLLIISVVCLCSYAYADRICLQKSTGKIIEYQSGNAKLGTLTENAIRTGYSANDIEEKYITREEFDSLREEKILKPERERRKTESDAIKIKENAIRSKLGLSKEEFDDLKEAMRQ